MKVLHVTPHLGGGVGKAHASLCGLLANDVQQEFLLLEEPRDRRHVDFIKAAGARVRVVDGIADVGRLARAADIVQFEFWNHPRMFECLARADLPAIRSVFWSHISGLFKPLIPPALIAEAGRFAFTTQASLAIPALADIPADASRRIAVINSGFGFPGRLPREPNQIPRIAYLGTVDFVKMHPGFFDIVDNLDGDGIQVSIWGSHDPVGPTALKAQAMKHPHRVCFRGETAMPADALAEADIFFYPLQQQHYGTAENTLVEAMSLGLVPVVLDNPAETAIVRHEEDGLVGRSLSDCATCLQRLLSSPSLRQRLSGNAIRRISETRTAQRSARDLLSLWRALAGEAPRKPNFRKAIGDSPADWFMATQRLPNDPWMPTATAEPSAAKGTLAHFEHVFAGDPSLARLRATSPSR